MASRDPHRPNILLVLTDDQGAWALGAAGNQDIHTPNLDRLAATGLRSSRFFCVSPVCSPARASLLTGRIPSAHGVHDWLKGTGTGPEATDYISDETLVTDILADHGYRCGLSGKWHLGANDKPRKGFVHWFAHAAGGGPYFGAPMVRDGEPASVDEYLTYALTADARSFIATESERDEPFFLAVMYTAPHMPWKDNHPTELTELYRDSEFSSCPQEQAHPWQVMSDDHPIGGEHDTHEALVGYFAAVTGVDAGVGSLLEDLEVLGLSESTLVIFSSDNGFNCGHHGIWGKGNATYPQNMYDSSVLVPALFAQPGRIAPNQVSDDLLSGYDLLPTILDYIGIAGTVDRNRDPGRSFASLLLADESWDPRNAVAVYDEYGPTRMIRTLEWKYVHRWPDGPDELYNLIEDPGERSNLANVIEYQQHAGELRTQLSSWFAKYVEAQHDGESLPVRGGGQISPTGTAGAFL